MISRGGRLVGFDGGDKGFLGLQFTDYFHLVKVDGRWKILSKTFTTE